MFEIEIAIHNKSTIPQTYILFASAPIVNEPTSTEVFANIFMVSESVQSPSGHATFKVNSSPYAVSGTSPAPLAPGTSVSTGDSVAIQLGNPSVPVQGSNIPVTVDKYNPKLEVALMKNTVKLGYTFVTGPYSLPDPNHMFLGFGGPDSTGEIVPLATFPILPNQTYNVTPVVKYFVGTGKYSPGEIINIQQIGPTILIDFTTGPLKAKITQHPDMNYTRDS